MSSITRSFALAALGLLAVAASPTGSTATAGAVTLDEAIDTALHHHTARAGTIRGAVEVAQQNDRARRINFYVPSVSFNGELPSYSRDQSYRFFGASPKKRLYETRGLGLNSFIQFHQNLITGGDLTLNANLTRNRDRYPDTDIGAAAGSFIDERSNRGFFDFSLKQPLLKPSTPRHELRNGADDLEIARLTRREEEVALTGEVIEAYVGVLRNDLQQELSHDRLERAKLQAVIDSTKWQDGVITEEAWLTSASSVLDAELAGREVTSTGAELRQSLALLLDRPPGDMPALAMPAAAPLAEGDGARLREHWEESTRVGKARRNSAKQVRSAEFTAASHGFTGDFEAGYSVGRGDVRIPDTPVDRIKTNSWNLALNFSYPLWDGGASSAAVKAARFEAERSRLELERTEKEVEAEIANLVDLVEVGSRRLELLAKRVELADARVGIAQGRLDDGRISRVTFLESKIALADAKSAYLDELRAYLVNRNKLEGHFLP